MKPSKHLFLFSSILLATFALRALEPRYYKRDLRQVAAAASERRSREIGIGWSRYSYASVSSSNVADSIVAKLRLGDQGLSDLQRERLLRRVLQVLDYLANPTFDGYYTLKTRGLQCRVVPTQVTTSLTHLLQFEKLRS